MATWFRVAPGITATHAHGRYTITQDSFPAGFLDGNSFLNGGGNFRVYSGSDKTVRYPVDVAVFVTGAAPEVEVSWYAPSQAPGDDFHVEADDVETTQPAESNAYGRYNAHMPGAVACIRPDGAGGAIDATGNTTPTVSGTLNDVPGPYGWGRAFDFTGSQQISISGGSVLTSPDFVMQSVLEVDQITTNHHVMGMADTSGGHVLWVDNLAAYSGNTNCLCADVKMFTGGPHRLETATDSIFVGSPRLVHFQSDYNSSGFAEVFLDGVADPNNVSAPSSIDTSNSGGFTIGDHSGFTDPLNGRLQDVRVYNGQVLTGAWKTDEAAMFSDQAAFWTVVDSNLDAGGGTPQEVTVVTTESATQATTTSVVIMNSVVGVTAEHQVQTQTLTTSQLMALVPAVISQLTQGATVDPAVVHGVVTGITQQLMESASVDPSVAQAAGLSVVEQLSHVDVVGAELTHVVMSAVVEQLVQAEMVNAFQPNDINTVILEQLFQGQTTAVVADYGLALVTLEQLMQGQTATVASDYSLALVNSQQLTEAVVVDFLDSTDIQVVTAEQISQVGLTTVDLVAMVNNVTGEVVTAGQTGDSILTLVVTAPAAEQLTEAELADILGTAMLLNPRSLKIKRSTIGYTVNRISESFRVKLKDTVH